MFEGQNIHLSPIDGKKLCSFSKKLCKQRRLNGYAFCVRHILEDSKAPFKQCEYKTKTNGERCINSVPIALDRVYCMNHLQVLGLAPKKPLPKTPFIKPLTSNKKKAAELPKTLKPLLGKNAEKINSCLKHKHKAMFKMRKMPNKSQLKDWHSKAVSSTNNSLYKLDIWKDSLNKETQSIVIDYIQSRDTKVLKNDFMGFYTLNDSFDQSPDSSIYQEELLVTKDRVYHDTLLSDNTSVQELKLLHKLKHQYSQLKQVIMSKSETLSYTKLSKLILAARSDAVQLANVLNMENVMKKPALFKNHSKVTRYSIPCSLITGSNRCLNNSLPFTKFCKQHLHHDNQQQLFTKCYDKHLNRAKCPGSKLNILQDHIILMKKRKKTLKSKRTFPSKLKELNEQESDQNKTGESASDLNGSFSSETTTDSYTSSSESEDDDDDGDISAPEEAFHLPPGSLSFAPRCRIDEEDALFRNANCELDDEDDELMCCSNEFSFDSKVPRELSSPTLNQLSTSDFDVSFNTLMDSTQSLDNESNPMTGSFLSYVHPENEAVGTPRSRITKSVSRTSLKTSMTPNGAEAKSKIYMKNSSNELKNTSGDRVMKRKQDFNHFSLSASTKPTEDEGFNKRYLSESITLMQPLYHERNLFDGISIEASSPLEKVNPDIFFSSVFPLTSDRQ